VGIVRINVLLQRHARLVMPIGKNHQRMKDEKQMQLDYTTRLNVKTQYCIETFKIILANLQFKNTVVYVYKSTLHIDHILLNTE
jgi:hypothetical protein